MSLLRETFFAAHNNVIRLTLSEDTSVFSVAYPTVTPTRWLFTIHATVPIVADSLITPNAFEWDAVHSILEIKLGTLVTTAMNYTASTLVVYAAEWPEGLVWFNPTCTPDKVFIRICA
jgi:hypothetical protein